MVNGLGWAGLGWLSRPDLAVGDESLRIGNQHLAKQVVALAIVLIHHADNESATRGVGKHPAKALWSRGWVAPAAVLLWPAHVCGVVGVVGRGQVRRAHMGSHTRSV